MDMTKPHLKTVTVVTEYWDCGRGHNHLTEDVARRCYEKYKNKEPARNNQQRYINIAKRWIELQNFKAVGKEFNRSGITIANRIRHFMRHIARRIRSEQTPIAYPKWGMDEDLVQAIRNTEYYQKYYAPREKQS